MRSKTANTAGNQRDEQSKGVLPSSFSRSRLPERRPRDLGRVIGCESLIEHILVRRRVDFGEMARRRPPSGRPASGT
jgi:hypothetical protein